MGTTTVAFNWEPDRVLLERLINMADRYGWSPETIVTEAVLTFLESEWIEQGEPGPDPLIGLFAGPADLAIRSEEILQ